MSTPEGWTLEAYNAPLVDDGYAGSPHQAAFSGAISSAPRRPYIDAFGHLIGPLPGFDPFGNRLY